MPLLIDVRTQEEFAKRHAPGAVNIPVDALCEGKLDILENLPKNTPMHLYCRSGGRSEKAKEALGLLGFTAVTNLGGLDDVKGV